ncbi:MAG: TetR/AcrR family transcriptional regulator [candidate division Zixibacteria bacterium]|nr:TetR/AcrR family transcriptional regulator [candidate division Zixibacteria bacterium]MDH3936988.1 TetR/AcrR family transcriptional regulator [candidate division Zixibacteria bacterium]MDH4033383.1 TetR/AcrR family transcriptional regulator [candidate division Zixibacteria bacterium]
MSRRQVEREARKNYILQKTRKLYDEQGIENSTMEDIARATEYTRKTLYAYFKSREEISLCLLTEDLKTRWAEQKARLTEAGTGLEKIIIWAEALYDYTVRHPSSIRLQLYWDLAGIDRTLVSDETFASFEAINKQLAKGLREVFGLGVKDGSLRPDLKIDMTISHFLYSIRTVINRALSPNYSFARFKADAYFETYMDTFARGVRQ